MLGGSTLFIYASLEVMEDLPEVPCAKYIPTAGDMLVGTLISVNASNNPAYGKTAFISFAVPAGTSS